MIIDLNLLWNAVQSGSWGLIPVILFSIGLCLVACVLLPRVLNRIIKPVIPTFHDDEDQEDVLRRWLSGFKYGTLLLIRLAAIVVSTLAFCLILIFITASIINRVSNAPIFSPLILWNLGNYLFYLGFFICSSIYLFIIIFIITFIESRKDKPSFGFGSTMGEAGMIISIGISIFLFASNPNLLTLAGVLYLFILVSLAESVVRRFKMDVSKPSPEPSFRFSKILDTSDSRDEAFLAKSKYYSDKHQYDSDVPIPSRPADMPFRLSKIEDSPI